MLVLLWSAVFVIALVALVKGADFLVAGGEAVGKYFRLPTFVIGALIIGIGTSLPELASSVAAVLVGEAGLVVSNAVGSNIANILLVAGLAAIVGKQIVSTKNLVNLEVPLLALSTALFIGVSFDGLITRVEALLVLFSFIIYVCYLMMHEEETPAEAKPEKRGELTKKDIVMLAGGSVLLFLGARYLIEAVVVLSEMLNIAPDVIAVSAVALGTSLPEILVSVTAVAKGKVDLAFGNVFGSNVFNMLMISGSIGIFTALPVDPQTLAIGIPFLAITTLLFIISTLTMRIYLWEGLMFLNFYLFFILKIFNVI